MTIGAMLGAVLSGRIADLLGRRGVSLRIPFTCLQVYVEIYIWCNKFFNLSFLLNFGYNCEAGNGTIRIILCCGVACNNILKGFLPFPYISVWIHYSIYVPFDSKEGCWFPIVAWDLQYLTLERIYLWLNFLHHLIFELLFL